MEVLAVTKGVRMSPLKVRAVARQIQGMHALEAQALLLPRRRLFASALALLTLECASAAAAAAATAHATYFR